MESSFAVAKVKICPCEPEEEPYCGDGVIDSGEQCDDGNNYDDDGCSANCTLEGDDDDDGGGGSSRTITKAIQEEVEDSCLEYDDARNLFFNDEDYYIQNLDLGNDYLEDEAHLVQAYLDNFENFLTNLSLTDDPEELIISQAYTEFLKGVKLIKEPPLQYLISGMGSYKADTGTAASNYRGIMDRLQAVKVAHTANCLEIYDEGELPTTGQLFTDIPRTEFAAGTPLTDLPQACLDAAPDINDTARVIRDCNWGIRIAYSGLDKGIWHGNIQGEANLWDPVTNAEAVKIFTRATGLTPEFIFDEPVGPDVLNFPVNISPSHWAWEYYKIGRYFEFVSEDEDNSWDGNSIRHDMFKTILRGIYITNNDLRLLIFNAFNSEDFVQYLEFEL